jgi:hypothetical protein
MCKHVAAVLYGIGARLDERPDLLFLLRNVDQQDLIAKAGKGLRQAKKRPAGKVLDTGDLSQIFGIEMAQSEPAPLPAVRRKRAVRAGSAQTPSRGRDGAPAPAGGKSVAPAPAKRTAQAIPKTATRAPALSAARRTAISARMKAYWRERQRRERERAR